MCPPSRRGGWSASLTLEEWSEAVDRWTEARRPLTLPQAEKMTSGRHDFEKTPWST